MDHGHNKVIALMIRLDGVESRGRQDGPLGT
jgi:hypothetical protein